MIYCHYFEFSYALLVFITGTVKGSRRCSTRRTNVWQEDSFSLGAHSRSMAREKQDGVSNWERAKADKVSLWKAVPLLQAIYCIQ